MSGSEDITVAPPLNDPPSTPAPGFTPGQVVAGRYRMVGLLGRGGMGEVYRADDLTLGTPVALKFLPRLAERDSAALDRFRGEVRIARQVSHPHVCRVFDIGEVDGRHFLSMEYVDGEDLAALLRRIGRLPPAKALELARQLCAGLSAAHLQGVLHRDLKPANIMVDGHGRARITDFGLAVVGSTARKEFAGTPGYMAPEQFAGEPASIRSDIYALGLVLYEMFTGTHTFTAATIDEWRRAHVEARPSLPSAHVGDLDAAVERVILRCLEKDPALRPPTAGHVALALPGRDPLAVAIAEGETPSPAMVAAAGGHGGLPPRRAWTLLAAAGVGLAALVAVAPYSSDFGLAPMTRSPDGLRDQAQEIVRAFGYDEAPRDDAWWLERDYDLLRWMADHLPSIEWRRNLRLVGAPVLLTYRRAGRPLRVGRGDGLITPAEPPAPNGSNDIRVVVDGTGRLREFVATPAAWAGSGTRAERPAPDLVFGAAALDAARFRAVAPQYTPPVAFDVRQEWEGTRSDLPDLPLRLSVAWFENRIVSAAVLGPWQRLQTPPRESGASFRVQQVVMASFILGVLGIITDLGRRNLRSGRGDRRGALTMAMAMMALSGSIRLLATHLASGDPFGPVDFVFGTAGRAVLDGLVTWLFYVAIEPYGRRRTPSLLIGWARTLEGRVSDPGVGRDVLVGIVAGLWLALAFHVANGLPTVLPMAGQTPVPGFVHIMRGAGVVARLAPSAAILGACFDGLLDALWAFALVIAVRVLCRPAVAMAGCALVFTLIGLGGENPSIEIPLAIVTGVALAWIANYRGLLTLAALLVTFRLVAQGATLGVSPTLWYGPHASAVLLGVVALAAWMFRVSVAGRAAFGAAEAVP